MAGLRADSRAAPLPPIPPDEPICHRHPRARHECTCRRRACPAYRVTARAGCGQEPRCPRGRATVLGVDGRSARVSRAAGRVGGGGVRPAAHLVEGVRFRRREEQGGDDTAGEVPHRLAQQDVRGHRHHAVAGGGETPARRPGAEAPVVVQGAAGGRRRWRRDHRASAVAHVGAAARGRRSLVHGAVPERGRDQAAVQPASGGVRAEHALEVLESRVRRGRSRRGADHRPAVGRLCAAADLRAARHEQHERGQESGRAHDPVLASIARRITRRAGLCGCARHGGGHRYDVERGRSREIRFGTVPPRTARGRERVECRVVARNAPRTCGGRELDQRQRAGLRFLAHQQPHVDRAWWRLRRQHYADVLQRERQGGRDRADQHERRRPGTDCRAAHRHGGRGGREGRARSEEHRGVGSFVGAIRGDLSHRLRRSAGGADAREVGDHHAERNHHRHAHHARAAWRWSLPHDGPNRRRGDRRSGALRGGERPGDPHDHR